jgi:hypothetical protein
MVVDHGGMDLSFQASRSQSASRCFGVANVSAKVNEVAYGLEYGPLPVLFSFRSFFLPALPDLRMLQACRTHLIFHQYLAQRPSGELTNNGSGVVSVRKHIIMHSPRIPNNQVSSINFNLNSLTSPFLRPRNFVIIKPMPVILHRPRLLLLHAMSLEKLVIKHVASFHDDQSAILKTVINEVYYTLSTLEPLILESWS